ncbi:hypothetical protein IWQ56_000184 [Coemansia nantahalensis]|nr:hypothetical protein IWQ56_000184 [Coemansia nantahalensis]
MAGHLLTLLMLLAAAVGGTRAHTHIHNIVVEGKPQESGKCIRPYMDGFFLPVRGVGGSNVLCRTMSDDGGSTESCPVKAGSTIALEYHLDMNHASQPIDPGHKGPCIAWLSPLAANGNGDVWVKIGEKGYDPATKRWCIDDLNASNGMMNVTIPADIADGEYLLRGEIIALHQAHIPDMVEFYANCVHIKVYGGGSNQLPPGVAIPGVYKKDDPGILFNIYNGYRSYPIPGPPQS